MEHRNFHNIYLAAQMRAAPSQTPSISLQPLPRPDPGPWKYNSELHAILHDGKSCKLCLTWLGHFVTLTTKKDKSLTKARKALDRANKVQKDVDDVQQRRDKAFEALAEVHCELETVWANLRNALQGQDNAFKGLKAIYYYPPLGAPHPGTSQPIAHSLTMDRQE